jgi:hypothetical protein
MMLKWSYDEMNKGRGAQQVFVKKYFLNFTVKIIL